ncbi:MAG: hypothetical protein EA397_04035 [Deltaproteobacteria bacterium]|nr:MAG: hypothetical protein EA397_04035 [Deltaproteobacteria bacterium]
MGPRAHAPPLLLASLLVLGACAPQTRGGLELNLPEAKTQVEAQRPIQVLLAAAGHEEPDPRARALELLLHTSADQDLSGLANRALWDPEPWVQRRATEALSRRLPSSAPILTTFLEREDELADPLAQSLAAHHLQGSEASIADTLARAWRREKRPWRAIPLQLAAARLGDQAALEGLVQTLAEGDLAMEPELMLAFGRSGLRELAAPLAQATPLLEDDILIAVLTARLLLEDTQAEKALRAILTGSDELAALEALDFLTTIDHPAAPRLIDKVRSSLPIARRYADLALAARAGNPDLELPIPSVGEDSELRTIVIRFAAEGLASHPPDRKTLRAFERLIVGGLADPEPMIRAKTLRAARVAPTLLPRATIEPHLRDEVVDVRIEAAGLLLMGG